MKQTLRISGLDCPVCAEALQSDLQKIKGVNSVCVDYVTQTITLEVEDETVVQKAIKIANKFEQVRVFDGGRYATKAENHLKEWLLIGFSAIFFVLGVALQNFVGDKVASVIANALYGVAYLTVGYPVLLSTAKNIVKGRIFDENFLMAVASLGAIALGEILEGVAVMWLYQLGELLQTLAVGSSRRSVAELLALKSERAVLLVDGEQKEVAPEALNVGDVVVVKAGEKAPVDGVLLDESAVLDTKFLTGEAELKKLKRGEEILSGCINVGGMYEMKVVRPYADSAVGRILNMVENASTGKAKPEKFIAKFAKYYTPIVCGLALILAVFVPLVSGVVIDDKWYLRDFERWVRSALTFLVISCPCALVISVPLTYFSGIGACAKKGILVKGATYLDVLATAKVFAFDKTGTLTNGEFSVRVVKADNPTEVLALAAAVEKGSAHPIARAFEEVTTEYVAEKVVEISGKGLTATVNGEQVLVGNRRLLVDLGIAAPEMESVYTLVYVAKGVRYLGVIEIGDTLRPDAKEALRRLKQCGVNRTVMLTGDKRERAENVANEVGMSEVNAELLPDGKLQKAKELKENSGLVYVGDGINDAPVMMAADCAVSMGKLGSAAAIEASDLVLISDDLTALPQAVTTARKCRLVVLQNILFSIVMKVMFMVLGAVGILPLWLAVFADVGVMLLAVLNSFRVRLKR